MMDDEEYQSNVVEEKGMLNESHVLAAMVEEVMREESNTPLEGEMITLLAFPYSNT